MKYGLGVECGSEPARESGVSVNINIDCDNAFASRLAPTGLGSGWKPHAAKPRKMAVILKQNGDHWPPFSVSADI
ncbi:hypothetical protein CD175_23410 [Pseudomonas laurylsulfatiphila]|uniref:Uncharacterized protein n=1 Tax=Pseudomonas laurylsulfatiphila TaxID=2011015 RepID=A0A2S6FGL9_9PSED|nr:hypothetical protein CD175_23410 [Pseudomonas laurylsulfatiphila]